MATTNDKQVIFSLVNVGKVYPPKRQVLREIYLGFYYGAKIGVLGLNGSGKSSLLRIIAGVDQNYTGEITRSKGYSVGLLEQEPQLDPGQDGERNRRRGQERTRGHAARIRRGQQQDGRGYSR